MTRSGFSLRRIIVLGIAAVIFFPPFVAGINFAQPTAEEFSWLSPSWFAFSLSGTIFQAGVLFLLFLYLMSFVAGGRLSWCRIPLAVPLFLFLLFFLLSLFKSVNLNESLKIAYQFLAYGGLFFLTVHCLKETREVKFLSGVVVFAAVLIAGYGLWQYLFLFDRLKEEVISSPVAFSHLAELLKRLEGKRVYSTFVYPPALGGYLILVFPVAVSFFQTASVKGKLLLLLPLSALALTGYLTFSRASWAAGLLALGIYLWLTQRTSGRRIRRKVLMSSGLVVLTILLLLLVTVSDDRLPRAMPAAESLRLRLGYWQTAGRMIKERFLFGFGPGSFGSVYSRYQPPGAGETQMAHNCLLQIGAESGIFAFLSLLALEVIALTKGWVNLGRIPRQRRTERNFLAGIFSGGVAFCLHSLVDVDFYVPGIAVTAVFFAGAFWARCSFLAGKNYREIKFSRPGLRLLLEFFLVVMTALCLAGIIRPALAEYHAQQAERLLAGGNFSRAEERYLRAMDLNPLSADYHFYLASRIYERQMLDQYLNSQESEAMRKKAIAEYQQAISRNRFLAFYHYRLGRLYVLGEEDEWPLAVEAFRQASFYYPASEFYRRELKQLYQIKSRLTE